MADQDDLAAQFYRVATLNVQGRDLTGLDFTFRVEKSLKRTQNSAEVQVRNLSKDSRRFLQTQVNGANVRLSAGYEVEDEDSLPVLFSGNLRYIVSRREGPDWVTEVTSGTADSLKKAPVSFSLGPGSSFKNAVERIITDIKGGVGNFFEATKGVPDKKYPNGTTIHGVGDDELERILAENGLEHSWQDDGNVQILPSGGATRATAITISEANGMIGSPDLGTKGSVKVRTLLNGDIYPGRTVHVQAENLDIFAIANKVVHSGDTAGNDWFTDLELRARK